LGKKVYGKCGEKQPTAYSPELEKKEEREYREQAWRQALGTKGWDEPKWHKSSVPSA